VLLSCGGVPEERNTSDTLSVQQTEAPDTSIVVIKTGNTNPSKLIAFSKTLKGIPYKYASSDPASGFDCSGFITYVFNHFNIEVPRTSVDFTDKGTPIDLSLSMPGDLILFTGTDSTIRTVGHMGIITHTGDSVVFIHATSGKAYGVTETTLNAYYMGRFMKVIRVFE
jgi:cell wall-associated NlpC family hydrolase